MSSLIFKLNSTKKAATFVLSVVLGEVWGIGQFGKGNAILLYGNDSLLHHQLWFLKLLFGSKCVR